MVAIRVLVVIRKMIHDRPSPKLWSGQAARWWQHKHDGWRVTLFKWDGKAYAFGKDTRPHLELLARFPALALHFAQRLQDMPEQSSIDMEVCAHGKRASSVPTALAGDGELRCYPFAVPFWNGQDLRHVPLDKIAQDFSIECNKFDGREDPMTLVDDSVEGVVLKDSHYDKWWKVKECRTCDAFVVGDKDGDGKYLGMMGSLVVSVLKNGKPVEVANVSGMSDDERLMLTAMLDDGLLLGRVIEVEYQYLGAKGRLRHPRFVRLRDDKPVDQCTWDQLGGK